MADSNSNNSQDTLASLMKRTGFNLKSKQSLRIFTKKDQRVPENIPNIIVTESDDENQREEAVQTQKSPLSTRAYTFQEDQNITRYILDDHHEALVGGVLLWQHMEADKVCGTRSWQSMKNRYRKNIVTNLNRPELQLTEEEKQRLRHKPKPRQKTDKLRPDVGVASGSSDEAFSDIEEEARQLRRNNLSTIQQNLTMSTMNTPTSTHTPSTYAMSMHNSPSTMYSSTPSTCQLMCPRASPQAAPRASPQASPRASPQASPRASPQASPRTRPQLNPRASPQPSPQESPRGAPYSLVEELSIIFFILEGNYETLVGGNNVWKKMEVANICGTRTWQSMKNRYRKNILTNLKRPELQLTTEQIHRLGHKPPKTIMRKESPREEPRPGTSSETSQINKKTKTKRFIVVCEDSESE